MRRKYNLDQLLKEHGITSYFLTSRYSIDYKTIQSIRKGKEISLDKLYVLCKIFNVKMDDFVTYLDEDTDDQIPSIEDELKNYHPRKK